jgi:inhibitor of KinA
MLNRIEFSVNNFAEDLMLIKCKSEALNQNPLIFWQLSKTLLASLTDIEVTPGEDSLAVKINILKKTRLQHLTDLKNLLGTYQPEVTEESNELTTVPICYDDEFALDMNDISLSKGISKAEVIHAHCGIEYQVKMIGFTPGFIYIGDLSDELTLPRLKTPRVFVPSGSIGLANKRTGIYSLGGPGGWPIIGRTPTNFFDPKKEDPLLIQPGMRLRFESITKEEFRNMLGN